MKEGIISIFSGFIRSYKGIETLRRVDKTIIMTYNGFAIGDFNSRNKKIRSWKTH